MEKLGLFLGMALATYFTRYVMIAALGREVPSLLQRWLRYVPAAVLAALVAPAALAPARSSGDGHNSLGHAGRSRRRLAHAQRPVDDRWWNGRLLALAAAGLAISGLAATTRQLRRLG